MNTLEHYAHLGAHGQHSRHQNKVSVDKRGGQLQGNVFSLTKSLDVADTHMSRDQEMPEPVARHDRGAGSGSELC